MIHIRRCTSYSKDMRCHSAHAQTIQVHSSGCLKKRFRTFRAAGMRPTEIMLADCTVLGYGQEKGRGIFRGYSFHPVFMAFQEGYSVKYN